MRSAPSWLLMLSAVLLVFLLLPLGALIFSVPPSELIESIAQPATQSAIVLSLATTGSAVGLIVLFGTPLAYLLGRSSSKLARLVQLTLQLPLVLPPAVAGVALLSAFGRQGLLLPLVGKDGLSIAFTLPAVILAQAFVAAPLYVRSASATFEALDRDLIEVAQTMGASTWTIFLRVALPVARPGLGSGAGLSAARALGEFGATLMFAGNLPGFTQTMPLAIYTALESDFMQAKAQSVLLLMLSVLLLALSQIRYVGAVKRLGKRPP